MQIRYGLHGCFAEPDKKRHAAWRQGMLHDELYDDMDPDYRSRIFLARKKLLSDVVGFSLMPEQGLNARALLNSDQFCRVQNIRTRRLSTVWDRFTKD